MNRFALIGASYKTAGVERLGQIALPKTEIAARLPSLAAEIGAQELAYIGTCNRVEFVLAGENPLEVQTCRDKLGRLLGEKPLLEAETRRIFRAWTDEGAVEHLFLVASGLDSAQAGEREIYAQVRGAWTTARAAGTCGPQLDYIFGEALRAAQDVHQQAARPGNADSLANFAVKRALEHLAERKDKPARVALVGVSPMTRHCARSFAAQNIPMVIVNRTLELAQEFAVEVKAEAMALDDFRKDPTGFDVIITAVGGAEPVLDRALLKRLADTRTAPLLLDLGVPPNIDPEGAEDLGLNRVGMDSVIADAAAGRTAKLGQLASARLLIDEHLERLRSEYAIRTAAPMLQRLTQQYQAAAAESLRRMPKNGNATEDAMRQWAEGFARRMVHVPMKGLRSLAASAGPAAVQAYLDGVEEALAANEESKDISKEKRS